MRVKDLLFSFSEKYSLFALQDVSSCSIGLADPGPPLGARDKLRTDSETGYGEDTGDLESESDQSHDIITLQDPE